LELQEELLVASTFDHPSIQVPEDLIGEALYLTIPDAEMRESLPSEHQRGFELGLHRLVNPVVSKLFELRQRSCAGNDVDVMVEVPDTLDHEPCPHTIRHRYDHQPRLPHPAASSTSSAAVSPKIVGSSTPRAASPHSGLLSMTTNADPVGAGAALRKSRPPVARYHDVIPAPVIR
jgi:hypothetical protein